MSDECDALVIGAGVVGMTTAYALAQHGLAVTIVARADEPARGTSFANGAQLSYVYSDALASPGLMRDLPRLLVAADPAFRFRPSLDPDFIRWGIDFLRNCTGARFRANTLAGLRLGLESRAAMHRLLARHNLEFCHQTAGKLHLLEGAPALKAAREMVKLKQAAGARQELIGAGEAVRLEPALESVAGRLSGAVYSPQEEAGDPYRFCSALLDPLKAEYGVKTRFGAQIVALRLSNGRASAVMADGEEIRAVKIAVCTGIDTPLLLRGTGIKVPIWPMKGYSVTAPPGPEAPSVSITDVRRRVVFCRLSGTMRIAGLADLGNRETRVDPRRLARLVGSARASLPGAADYAGILSSWAGLRPMTPSSLPIIRRDKGGIVLNVGHGTLGWTFAMGAAERAARLMVDRQW